MWLTVNVPYSWNTSRTNLWVKHLQTKYYVNRHTELNAASCVIMVLQVIYTEMSSARVHERGLMFNVFVLNL